MQRRTGSSVFSKGAHQAHGKEGGMISGGFNRHLPGSQNRL